MLFESQYYGEIVPGISSISVSIAASRTVAKLGTDCPAFFHLSAKDVTILADDSTYAWDRLEYRWAVLSSPIGYSSPSLTNPLRASGIRDPNSPYDDLVTISPDADQVGPEAVFRFNVAGTYVVCLSARGFDGADYFTASDTITLTVVDWDGTSRYIDPFSGDDSGTGEIGDPWKTYSKIVTELDDDIEFLIKRSETLYIDNSSLQIRDVSGVRFSSYGSGDKPVIVATDSFPNDAFFFLGSDGEAIDDIGFSNLDIKVSGQNANAINSAVTGGVINDIYFDNCDMSAGFGGNDATLCTLQVTTAGTATAKGWGFWDCSFDHGNHGGQGLFLSGGGRHSYAFVVGGSFINGSGNIVLDHHWYPSRLDNILALGISFGLAQQKNFCVNGNCTSADTEEVANEYYYVSCCDITGTQNGLDASNAGGGADRDGLYDHVVYAFNAFHGLAQGDSQGILSHSKSGKRISFRDNIIFDIKGGSNALLHFGSSTIPTDFVFVAHRNKIHFSSNADVDKELLSASTLNVTEVSWIDNKVDDQRSDARMMALDFVENHPSTGSVPVLSDYNTWYHPNDATPFYDIDAASEISFATWEANGSWEDNSVDGIDPDWSDPDIGDFSLDSDIRYLVMAGDSNFDDVNIWSTSSGGATGASVPTEGMTVVVDWNSGEHVLTQDIDVDLGVGDFDATLAPPNFTLGLDRGSDRILRCRDFIQSSGIYQQSQEHTLILTRNGTFGDIFDDDGFFHGDLKMLLTGKLTCVIDNSVGDEFAWDNFYCADAGHVTTIEPTIANVGSDFIVRNQLITQGGKILWSEALVAVGEHLGFEFGIVPGGTEDTTIIGNPTIDGGEIENESLLSAPSVKTIGKYTFANTRSADMTRGLDVTGSNLIALERLFQLESGSSLDYSEGGAEVELSIEKVSTLMLNGGSISGLYRVQIGDQSSGDRPASLLLGGGSVYCSDLMRWNCVCSSAAAVLGLGDGGFVQVGFLRSDRSGGLYHLTGTNGAKVACTGVSTPSESTTVYVANAPLGDDSNDGLSTATPKKTIDGALMIADGTTRIIFRRGQIFDILDGTEVDVTGVRFGSLASFADSSEFPILRLGNNETFVVSVDDVEFHELDIEFLTPTVDIETTVSASGISVITVRGQNFIDRYTDNGRILANKVTEIDGGITRKGNFFTKGIR